MPKIMIDELSAEELSSLPRTTQWRAKKRGWVFTGYHTPRTFHRDDIWYVENYASIDKIVRRTINKLYNLGCFPHPYMGQDDISQDIRLYLLLRADRIKKAENPRNFTYKLAWDAGCKSLGLYGGKRISLRRTCRNETKEK